jgi:hypothetical protein
MSEAWERLTTEMLRHMIREFLAHPAEFMTFTRLAFLIRAATNEAVSSDLLHVIAEQRSDLFIITRNDRGLKLFTDALERIVSMGVDSVIAEPAPVHSEAHPKYEHHRCNHFSGDDEILDALTRCSFGPPVLTRSCCWKEICRVRGMHSNAIDADAWREICSIRGYLQERQNPRGF